MNAFIIQKIKSHAYVLGDNCNILLLLISFILLFLKCFSLHYFPLDGMLGQRLFGIFDTNRDEKIHAGEFLSKIY